MSSDNERPWADEQTEQRVRATFPADMSPEEFAARDGYGWLDFPFAAYRYHDTAMDQWIQEVSSILRDPQRMRHCQQKYLTSAERLMMQRYMDDDNEAVDED